MGYKVKLETFEGPFDLLVYLIENAKMSIYDIQVSEITAQYIAYIEKMQQMDIAVSSEFMVLAAELIELKSRMLLPRINNESGAPAEDDPRSDLVSRILEYKKYKAASEILKEAEDEARLIREKPQEDISSYLEAPDEVLKLDMNQFVNAFNAFIRRKQKIEEIERRYKRIEREKISAEQRMDFIRKLFDDDPNKVVNFKDTVQYGNDKYDTVLSFSSLMEMVKQGELTAEQQALFADIMIKAKRLSCEEVE